MSDDRQDPAILHVDALPQRRETRFTLEPDAAERGRIAEAIGAGALRKLRFSGTVAPKGKRGWQLRALLGATAVQPCIVTLEPVTTRIDTEVERLYLPEDQIEAGEAGSETEMQEDDDRLEILGPVIDLRLVMSEALSLALPAYPRKADAAMDQAQFAEDGVTPMRDEDAKPFAGLAALRDKLHSDRGED